jgi:hypothetical protein
VNVAIVAAIAPAQVSAKPGLSGMGIRVMAVIQDHQLHIAKDGFYRVVIWAAFGQTDPVQVQLPHHSPRSTRFDRVSTVLVQRDPHWLVGIPAAYLSHELTHLLGAFARQHHPMHLATDRIVADEQVEEPACFLSAGQHQSLGRGIAPAAIGFHRNRLDIEKQQPATRRQMLENPADPGQAGGSLRILADELALDAPQMNIVFLATDAGAPAR